jgi:hypothetical protein
MTTTRFGRRAALVSCALLWLAACCHCGAAHGQTANREGDAFFEKEIRPLLVGRCYKCHSHEAKEVKGKLYLDSRPGWQKGGESGPAVVPGKPEESLLIDAVRYGTRQMPPDSKLPAVEVALLERWVKMGAPDPRTTVAASKTKAGINFDEARKYWAFQPLRRVEPPAVKNGAWCRTAIDRFVLAKLEAARGVGSQRGIGFQPAGQPGAPRDGQAGSLYHGISPAPPAARRTLIRRAYFDLIGLPPTPDEIGAFVKDSASDDEAYGRVLDRLLDSPHFGERWARHWLDVARFAESHGFEQDYDRPYAFHYRDFVIKAFNQDMPYDQFVRWQLAGDELAPDEPLALMATGFLGAGVFPTQITANEVEKSRYDALDDMAATTGTAMLGLTIGCARCHDHKFDPIPADDYYRLVSTFTTTVRSNIDLDLNPAVTKAAQAKFDAEHTPLVAARDKFERDQLPGRLEQWARERTKDEAEPPAWVVLDIAQHKSAGGASFLKLSDGSLLANGANPPFDTYTFVAETTLRGVTALRIEALAHSTMPKGGPGRASNGNFALSDVRVTARPISTSGSRSGLPSRTGPARQAGPTAEATPLKLVAARSTFDQQALPVTNAIDADKKSAWAVDPQFGKDHAAVLEFEAPIGFEGGTEFTVVLEFQNNTGHNIGRSRLSLTTASSPVGLEGNVRPRQVVEALAKLDKSGHSLAKLNDAERAALLTWYRSCNAEWQKLNQRVQDHLRQAPQPNVAKVMVASEGVTPIRHHTQGADFFNEMYFLRRGDPNQKAGVASQGFLQVLMTTPEKEKHWQEPPPKGWRTSYRRKALAAWMTDTQYGAGDLLARVIVNRLWHHHTGRGIVGTPSDFGVQGERPSHPELLDWLATELIRGGWRLKPLHKLIMTSAVYRQGGDFDDAKFKADPENKLCWRHPPRRLEAEVIRDSLLAVTGTLDRRMFGEGTLDQGMTRRSIYFTIKRSQLIPMLQLFDVPEPNASVGRRPSTTIAPQALMFLNNPHVRSWSRNFARRLTPAAERSLAEVAAKGYLAALGRRPTEGESADAVAFLEQQTTSYQGKKRPEARELALADFCQVLMSLNEFVYVD